MERISQQISILLINAKICGARFLATKGGYIMLDDFIKGMEIGVQEKDTEMCARIGGLLKDGEVDGASSGCSIRLLNLKLCSVNGDK